MKTFTIENETNNITIHVTVQDAEAVANAERFRNEAGLAKLAADWPASRLVDIWKSLPGATPVRSSRMRDGCIANLESDSEPWQASAGWRRAVPGGSIIVRVARES
jgi:hypothetical protein